MSTIKKTLFIIIPLMILFIVLLYNLIFESIYEDHKSELKKYSSRWQNEISESIYSNKNKKYVSKIIDGLKTYPVTSYKLVVNDTELYKWVSGHHKSAENCLRPVKNVLTFNGIYFGYIQSCLSNSVLVKKALFSPLFIFVILTVILLLIASSFLPLFRYRKSLNKTINILENWNKNPGSNLDISNNDEETDKLVALVKKGIDVRLNLIELKGDLDKEKEISKIIKQVAHDIRSPIMSLNDALNSGNVEIQGELTKKVIKSTMDSIQETSESLLESERKNKYRLNNIRSAKISDLISDTLRDKQYLYRHIKFSSDIHKNSEAICSPPELKRVVSNLLSNSVEAIPNGSGEIKISVTSDEKKCLISVEDNGVGIKEDKIDRVFDENYSVGKAHGTGLGLYYAKKMLNEWGGKVELTSEFGKGTKVKLLLKSSKLELEAI
jgi:signal transduction histidine kinase